MGLYHAVSNRSLGEGDALSLPGQSDIICIDNWSEGTNTIYGRLWAPEDYLAGVKPTGELLEFPVKATYAYIRDRPYK